MDQVTPRALSYDAVAVARHVAATAATRAEAQDRDDGFPTEDVADLARLGLLAAVLRLVGYGSLALGRLYEGHVNALQLVARYGTPEQRERLFADACDGHLFGVWNTEPLGGGLVLEDGMRLAGVKTFASGAGYVTRALVTGRSPGGNGTVMLVVPLGAGSRADLSAWRAYGMRASATGTLDFAGIAIAAEDILGDPDDYFRQPDFSGGAWRFTAVQLGGIEAVFDAWRGHLAATGR
ncbi:MAG: acyl-CoA dehydrogenase, partial [Alphaproteobacteria bacterium]